MKCRVPHVSFVSGSHKTGLLVVKFPNRILHSGISAESAGDYPSKIFHTHNKAMIGSSGPGSALCNPLAIDPVFPWDVFLMALVYATHAE